MEICRIVLVLIAFSGPALLGQAWSYIGIPYVTDEVPDEIMPTLPNNPSGNGNSWPTYDPSTIANPTFADGATQYYVDSVNGDDGTAGNSSRGSVANPRKTMPNLSGNNLTMAAGTQIFITDNSVIWDEASEEDRNILTSGTAANPCWILGVDTDANSATKPQIASDKFFMDGTHLILDGLLFKRDAARSNTGMRIKFGHGGSGFEAQYITLRNSEIDGQGEGRNTAIGGSSDGTARSEFIYIYNNDIHDLGLYATKTSGDKHAIQMTAYSSHWWVINNTIYDLEGDGVQVNTSGQSDGIYARRPHYIYIAGNDISKCYENALDNKNGYHVVFSENSVHDMRNSENVANKTAILHSNNSEGWLSSYHWTIYNKIWNVERGIRDSGTGSETLDDPDAVTPVQTAGEKNYIIGNLIWNSEIGIVIGTGGTSPNGAVDRQWLEETWFLNNTIIASEYPIQFSGANNAATESSTQTVSGNIVYNLGSNDDIANFGNSNVANTFVLSYNVVDRQTGTVSYDTSNVDTLTGNINDATLAFVSTSSSDWTLQASSDAVDVSGFTATPSPYTTFNTLYGISITTDLNNGTRPDSTVWDAGAYERGSGVDVTGIALADPPDADPTSLVLTPGDGQITVSWTDNATNEISYTVERRTSESGNLKAGFGLAANTTSFVDTGINNGTTYYYTVVASTNWGDSGALTGSAVPADSPAIATLRRSSRSLGNLLGQ